MLDFVEFEWWKYEEDGVTLRPSPCFYIAPIEGQERQEGVCEGCPCHPCLSQCSANKALWDSAIDEGELEREQEAEDRTNHW